MPPVTKDDLDLKATRQRRVLRLLVPIDDKATCCDAQDDTRDQLYTVDIACSNCKCTGEAYIRKQHEAHYHIAGLLGPRPRCPSCGVRALMLR